MRVSVGALSYIGVEHVAEHKQGSGHSCIHFCLLFTM